MWSIIAILLTWFALSLVLALFFSPMLKETIR